jgi:hypothetical protein
LCTTAKFAADRQLWVNSGSYRIALLASASPQKADITCRALLAVIADALGTYPAATLAASKGLGCNLDIVAWLTP